MSTKIKNTDGTFTKVAGNVKNELVTDWESSPSNVKAPSEKLVYDTCVDYTKLTDSVTVPVVTPFSSNKMIYKRNGIVYVHFAFYVDTATSGTITILSGLPTPLASATVFVTIYNWDLRTPEKGAWMSGSNLNTDNSLVAGTHYVVNYCYPTA